MDRRWRQEADQRYLTLLPYREFLGSLPRLEVPPMGLADAADVYATYSLLHSKGRNPQPRASVHKGFYYFIADAVPSAAAAAASKAAPSPGPQAAPAADSPAAAAAVAAPPRYEAVVPVGSKYQGLTLDVVGTLFSLEAEAAEASHVLLAITDDDGSVSLVRLFNYIQPPFEGPETLPPVQVAPPGDDSEG